MNPSLRAPPPARSAPAHLRLQKSQKSPVSCAKPLKKLKTAMGKPCQELAWMRGRRRIFLGPAPRLLGLPRRISLDRPDAIREARFFAGSPGALGASDTRLGSCSRPEMAPQAVEIAQNAPGNGGPGRGREPPRPRAPQCASALTIESVIFLASPNSIIVLSRKKSSFSTPAYPEPMPRLTNSTVLALSTSRTGMP